MKIESLKRRNIVNFSAAVILLGLFIFSIYYNSGHNEELQREATMAASAVGQIKAQTNDLQSKTREFKKYREIWPEISESKKNTIGIKMDDINSKLTSIGEKYTIMAPSIKVSLPENMNGGLFDRSTVNVLFSKMNLYFEALDDARAMGFLMEFLAAMPGYPVLSEFNMTKNRDYTSQDLVAISQGRGVAAIRCNVTVSWYALKAKEIKPQEGQTE